MRNANYFFSLCILSNLFSCHLNKVDTCSSSDDFFNTIAIYISERDVFHSAQSGVTEFAHTIIDAQVVENITKSLSVFFFFHWESVWLTKLTKGCACDILFRAGFDPALVRRKLKLATQQPLLIFSVKNHYIYKRNNYVSDTLEYHCKDL